ncbi:GNAT family N-acetyltransferase [Kribbella sp. NPDC048915]|uniref:GNAT family N-acetyltransferase n=1 Tax=Kribbella sp. NPDC048915 TaxID=3155148 RepID=UPI0033F27F91
MNTLPTGPGVGAVTITRVADHHWHAIENDLVVGRGHTTRRLDGRTFVSIDTWRDDVFDHLATAVRRDHRSPLHTVVDETDHDLTAQWIRAGFRVHRIEAEYVVPTATTRTPAPPGVQIVTDPDGVELRALDEAIRAEIAAAVGWHTMPAEILPWQGGTHPIEPAGHTVAIRDGRYVGLIRLATRTRRARIGLIAVRTTERRRGIGRALLTHALDRLHREGFEAATAEVDETNTAGIALLRGAERTGRALELISGRA